MTLTSKGSRRIVVDGLAFRWLVRRRPTYCQALGWSPLTFVVELLDEPGALLVVALPYAHPGNWLGLPSTSVLPATVAAGIHQALATGWQPGRPGPAFALTLDEALL
ncbi:hypothetical protein [Actinoplanes sp. NPDC026623]|uniref:hypothetical protein n=1 Tax=Actinoplanes sp. NPDC026623 TaxID=3155610 RepID=UPI0033DE4EA6